MHRFLLILVVTFVFGSLSISAQTPAACPTIKVIGPAGVIRAGDQMTFLADVSGKGATAIEYDWMISAGTIVAGQGTPSITIQTDRSIQGVVTAFLSVKWLPAGCKTSASREGRIECSGDPPLIDEYGELKQREEIARLDDVIAEYMSRPGWVIYIVEYAVSERSEKTRASWIKSYFARKKISPEQLHLVSGGRHPTGRRRTKIYFVPPNCPSS
jgi:hypothetical protein